MGKNQQNEEEYTAKSSLVREETGDRKQLRFNDLIYAVRKHVVLIVICAAVGLVFGIVLSVVSYMRGEMSKQYAIKTSICVTSQNRDGLFTTQRQDPDSSDFDLAQNMVESVIYVMQSDKMLNRVIDEMNLVGISARDIYNNLSVQQYFETQIIEITLYWRSAEEGVEILETMNEISPDVLIDTLKIGSVAVINDPTSRYLIGGNLNAAMWGYMMVLGAMLGIGFSVLDLLLRPTLLKTGDMEKMFQIETLGEIPEKKGYFNKKRNLLTAGEDDDLNADVLDNFVSIAHILKTRLSRLEHPCIYVTSAAQNEGKTTVTAYLATYLADIGMKVLLIDFDIRNPKLGGLFLNRVEYTNSINALYRGETIKADAITSLTGNLDILPAVLERKPMPFDDALLDMVSDLKEDYDVVLMDTAPVGQVADTMSLNELADLALLVVRFDGASLEVIRDGILRLDKSGIRLVGCVINGVKTINNTMFGSRYHQNTHYTKSAPSRKTRTRNKKSVMQQEWEAWEKEQQNEGAGNAGSGNAAPGNTGTGNDASGHAGSGNTASDHAASDHSGE